MRKKKYKTNNTDRRISNEVKKNPKADIRNWSSVFFTFALAGLTWGSVELLGLTEYTPIVDNSSTGVTTTVVPPNTADTSAGDEKILVITPEELQNIQNTIAYTHAVWPGYRGDVSDGRAVRKHFSQNLGKVILQNARGFNVEDGRTYKVHFYYVVRKDGAIQYLAIVKGGRTTPNVPIELIKNAQTTMSIGIPGITPGTNSAGEPITVVYELAIVYKPGL